MRRKTVRLQKEVKIKGKNDSLWGESGGTYLVKRFTIVDKYDDDLSWGNVNVYGKGLKWYQYTDSKIEKEVKRLLMTNDNTIKDVYWSEQGMQPENSWNFDVEFKKTIKKKKK